jgi:hypothetical protein
MKTQEESSSLPAPFCAIVAAQLRASGYTVASWESTGVNVLPPNACEEQYIGLANLYRRARAANVAEWPQMIREFLVHLTNVTTAQSIPDDLTSIADRLRPRIGRPFDRSNAHPWGIPLPGTELEITLVIDFPHTMAFVTEQMLKKSRKRGEDLLEVALENLRIATPEDFFERASPEHDIYLGHTGDGYDASRALIVEELLPESPAGFWVAVPTREELAVWPVSFTAMQHIHGLHLFATENYREHAYPISEDVYWVWHGTWHSFITSHNGESVIDPPDLFIEALRELGGHDCD